MWRGFSGLKASLALVFLVSFLLAKIACQYQNTLYHHGGFLSSKTTLEKGVLGSVKYLTTRVALKRDRLDLSAWHGFQEIFFKKLILNPGDRIDFDFFLEENSYGVFYFAEIPGSREKIGFRPSRNPLFPSSFLRVKPDGFFTAKIPHPVSLSRKNHLEMVFQEERSTLFLNGQSIAIPRELPLAEAMKRVGFKGAYAGTSVDNIRVVSGNGEMKMEEDFTNKRNFLLFAAFPLVFLLLLLRAVGPSRWSKVNLVLFSLSLGLVLFWAVDFYYFSSLYPSPSASGSLAGEFFFPTYVENEEDRDIRLKKILQKGHGRKIPILVLGTSQTWGAGAEREAESMVSQLAGELERDQGLKGRFTLINAGASAVDSSYLLEKYRKEWVAFLSPVVLVNLSNNDYRDPGLFRKNLVALLEENRKRGVRTVLILEGNTPEGTSPQLLKNHGHLRDLSRIYEVPLVDLHGYLAESHDQGHLWWDFVHLSSYGQKLAARKIASDLRPLLLKTLAKVEGQFR